MKYAWDRYPAWSGELKVEGIFLEWKEEEFFEEIRSIKELHISLKNAHLLLVYLYQPRRAL